MTLNKNKNKQDKFKNNKEIILIWINSTKKIYF